MCEKNCLKAENGMPLTQGLFLEIGYTKYSVYTLKDADYEYKGRVFPSLKRIYLEMSDAGEYEFATTHLLGWSHWQRLCANKQIAKHIEEWRYELELKLRSEAIRLIRLKAGSEKGINAAKWLAERGWDKRGAGRPTKEDIEHETKVQADIHHLFAQDLDRLKEG